MSLTKPFQSRPIRPVKSVSASLVDEDIPQERRRNILMTDNTGSAAAPRAATPKALHRVCSVGDGNSQFQAARWTAEDAMPLAYSAAAGKRSSRALSGKG